MKLEFALKEYGLTDKETKVYLALLPLGQVKLQELAKRIDLPRTTIYNTLNYLVARGLVAFIAKKGVRYYQATAPGKLVRKIEEKRELLSSVLPDLKALQALEKEPSSVEMYEGSKGLFTILSDVFQNESQEKLYFGSYRLSKEVLKHQPAHFRTIRMEKKIRAKIVIEPCHEDIFDTRAYRAVTQMRHTKALEGFPCMIFIYGHKVALYTLKKDLIGLIINNEQVANAMRMIFKVYWGMGKAE